MDGAERDIVCYGKPAFRKKCLIRRKRVRLKEAVWVVRIDTNHNRAQRNVPLLCSETQSLHLLAVERFGAGEVDQIRMCQIGIQTGVQSCNTLIHISFQYFGIVRRFVDIGAIDLVVNIVLAEQQIVDGILCDARKQLVKKPG